MKKAFLILMLIIPWFIGYGQDPDYCPDEGSYWNLEDALKEPEKVRSLILTLKEFKEMPQEIDRFVNLECLDISNNEIVDFPDKITKLTKLRYIKMSGLTGMQKLPRILKRLPSIKIIELKEYPTWKEYQFDDAQMLLPNVKFIRDDKFQR